MSYSDAFLALHRYSPRQYELSALRTGSIRDQILRATLLVQRLVENAEFLVPGEYGLLVLGGGAAGVAASLTAAELGIHVKLVELNAGKRLFETQRAAPNRWIDPCEFDWPHSIWRPTVLLGSNNHRGRSEWPSQATDSPLHFIADYAFLLADRWQKTFDAYVAKYPGLIELVDGTDARGLNFNEESDFVEVANLNATTTRFGAAISCIGFAGERTTLPAPLGDEYHGYKFWGDDPYTRPNLGLTRPGRRRATPNNIQVLVSGSGDGAQQDIARILTGTFGRALFEAMEAIVEKPLVDDSSLLAVAEADDKAKRAYAWRATDMRPADILAAWHTAYEIVADAAWKAIDPTKRYELTNLLVPHIDLTWITREEQPDFCYALNRFLTLFLLKIVTHANGRLIVSPSPDNRPNGEQWIRNHSISSVACSAGGRMPMSADAAHKLQKLVHVTHKATAQPIYLGDFDVVVVRHGVIPQPLFGGGAPVPEQLVPYDFIY